MSGNTAQDKSWKSREQGEEAQYIRQKEAEQLAAIRQQMAKEEEKSKTSTTTANVDKSKSTDPMDRDFEGGFGGQEDLEDRYATTSGEH
ncbi:hypothetical protein C8Q75DRAFT_739000 [Abortiporus biennis]|nr:hypothetical protein C8Q75DRAFT_739000 [Abortiporus biennis]